MTDNTIKKLCLQAEKEIETLSATKVLAIYNKDNVKLIDVRDIRELWINGTIPGSFHAPRGMLEFWIDEESPYHRKEFSLNKKYIFFCAAGMRSALAAKTAKDMGLKSLAHIKGGYEAWIKANGPTKEVYPNFDKYK